MFYRIKNDRSSTPGVVIATMKSKEEKESVMKCKNKLKDSLFSEVFIHHDQSREERVLASNMQAIVTAVNAGSKLSVRGQRVFSKNSAHADYSRDHSRNNHATRGGDRRGSATRNANSGTSRNDNGRYGNDRNEQRGASEPRGRVSETNRDVRDRQNNSYRRSNGGDNRRGAWQGPNRR